jgi:hypothetical protein
MILEALGDAEPVLAGPDEARDVVRVDGERRHDVAGVVGDAFFIFSGQGPQLAAGDFEMVVGFSLSPR